MAPDGWRWISAYGRWDATQFSPHCTKRPVLFCQYLSSQQLIQTHETYFIFDAKYAYFNVFYFRFEHRVTVNKKSQSNPATLTAENDYATKSPLVTIGCPHLPPKLPFPFDNRYLHLIHSSVDRPHSLPQTASRSNQPCFHNSSTAEIDRRTRRQACTNSRIRSTDFIATRLIMLIVQFIGGCIILQCSLLGDQELPVWGKLTSRECRRSLTLRFKLLIIFQLLLLVTVQTSRTKVQFILPKQGPVYIRTSHHVIGAGRKQQKDLLAGDSCLYAVRN